MNLSGYSGSVARGGAGGVLAYAIFIAGSLRIRPNQLL